MAVLFRHLSGPGHQAHAPDAQPADCFVPAKELLDTLVHDLAGPIGTQTHGATIEPGVGTDCNVGHTGADLFGSQPSDEQLGCESPCRSRYSGVEDACAADG